MLSFLLIVGVILYVFLRNWKDIRDFIVLRHRARKAFEDVPGPPDLPLIGSAHLFSWDNVEFSRQLFEWETLFMEEKGMVRVWLGPVPIAALGRAKTVKPILESMDLITKPAKPGYEFVRKWIGDGLLTSTGAKWQTRRKMISPTFHFNVLQSYCEVFAKQGKTMVDVLEKHSQTDEWFDIFPFFKRVALDVICETAMGTEIHSQTGGNMDYVNAVKRVSDIIWKHERLPWLWLKPIWYLSGYGFEFDKLVQKTNDFTRKVIADRKKVFLSGKSHQKNGGSESFTKPRLAFLDQLLEMQQEEKLTDEDIREEVDTFMFEGHDTTSAAMGFAVWFLGNNPKDQKKVHEEMDAIFGDSDRFPTSEDLKQCVYLERCIKESLRMCPSVPIVARTLTQDVAVGETVLPEGMMVIISPFACQRDEKNYAEPYEFHPDHFDLDKYPTRDPYSYIPFSAGPRNCIGQKFAIQEEKSILSWFFRKYSVTSLDRDLQDNMPVPELILKPNSGFRVKIQKRE